MKAPISPSGRAKLLAELDHLSRVERPRVSAEIQWAASLGDRSENSEYIYGKQRMREIDRRLRYLQGRLEETTLVDPAGTVSDQVGFGAIVEVEDEDGKPSTWTFLGVDEVDIPNGVASLAAPIGRALSGRREGDTVVWETPRGPRELTVIAIRYPPARPA
jgi:transcription elongation factor GreB